MKETIFNVFTRDMLVGSVDCSFKDDVNSWIRGREKEGYEVSKQSTEAIKTSSFEHCLFVYVWMQREKKDEERE